MKRPTKATDELLVGYLNAVYRDTRQHLDKHGVIDKKLHCTIMRVYYYVYWFCEEQQVGGYLSKKLSDSGTRLALPRLDALLNPLFVRTGKYRIRICCVLRPENEGIKAADILLRYLRHRKLTALSKAIAEDEEK